MAPGRPKSARTLAIDVLNRFNPKRDYAASILNNLLDQTADAEAARGLIMPAL